MPPAGKGAKVYKIAERFPSGTIVTDFMKKKWALLDVLGQGGFGLIYLGMVLPLYCCFRLRASLFEESDLVLFVLVVYSFLLSTVLTLWGFKKFINGAATKEENGTSDDEYVIKIEPKSNGPLFCEMYFYQRLGKEDTINAYASRHKKKYLGIPPLKGTGLHEYNNQSFRFLVLKKYGLDLDKVISQNGGVLEPHTAFAVALRLLDDLQYMHENEYVHADVKASNILLGYERGNIVKDQVFLLDYGLAFKYFTPSGHVVYKEDPRKAHDGTIEYTSRDAHKGVSPSRRSDLEILGYNLVHWISGCLPWMDKLGDTSYVAKSKEKYMSNISSFLSTCFESVSASTTDCVKKFLVNISSLNYEDTPNYRELGDILRTGMTKAGHKNEWILDLPLDAKKGSSSKTGKKSPLKKKPATPEVTTRSPRRPPAKKPAAAAKTTRKKTSKDPEIAHSKVSPAKRKAPPVSPVPRKRKSLENKSSTKQSKTISDSSTDAARPRATIKRRRRLVNGTDASVQTSPGLALRRK